MRPALLRSLLALFRAPGGGSAAAPLDEQRVVQADGVRVEAGPPQELQQVGGAEGAAEDFAVAADAAPALGVRWIDDYTRGRAHPFTLWLCTREAVLAQVV